MLTQLQQQNVIIYTYIYIYKYLFKKIVSAVMLCDEPFLQYCLVSQKLR